MALLRYSQNVQFSCLNVQIRGFQGVHRIVQPSLLSFRPFLLPCEEMLCPVTRSTPPPLATTHLLSVYRIAYSGHFIDGIVYYVFFCDRLLSLSIWFQVESIPNMDQYFILACDSIVVHHIHRLNFAYSFISWCTFGWFPPFGCYE